MGVRGLLSTCLRNRDQCADIVDLVEEARKNSGIELLCDFYSFEHLVVGNFWKSLTQVAHNDFLPILGGEYKILDHYVNKLVNDLKALDIHLVMIIDASKGSSKRGTEAKIDTWNHRHYQDMEKLQQLLDVCNGQRQIRELPSDVKVRPVLLEVQFRQTLNECGCEIIQCVWGEADFVIAKALQEREKAFAILSNDSDFCIFRHCRFIPNELFDLKGDLRLGGDQPYTEKPIRLECGIISSAKMATFLGFPDESHLVELSIIAGNDFTGPHLPPHLLSKIGIKKRPSVNDYAAWVKKHGHVENVPELMKEMQKNRKLDDAVHTSRQFYSISFPPEESNVKGDLTRYLQEGIEQGRYPAAIMGMHLNFYWYRMLLEDISEGAPSIELALAPLRSYIYRIILDRKDNMVIEHGRKPFEQLRASPVYVNREKGICTANYMTHDKIFPSLRMFARIMRHQEPDFPTNFFDRYGWRNGFSYFCLRYMLRLNSGNYLHITLDEFLVLFATVFCLVDETWYQVLSIVPTTRCVTIGNWFQDIYRHAFSFLGKLFHLTHEFPLPKDVFSGAVYTAFYMIRIHQGMLMRHGFPPDWSMRINREYKKIIDEKKHILRYVLEGIHTMNTRY